MQGDSAEDERMIEWALEVTNLMEYRDREVSRLSGGQRQRVWIAMALCQGTKTLFLDEPTTYLDIRYQIEILQLVKKLNQEFGITIIMVLHDINQAIAYSDNVIGMKDGKVLVEGDPEESDYGREHPGAVWHRAWRDESRRTEVCAGGVILVTVHSRVNHSAD